MNAHKPRGIEAMHHERYEQIRSKQMKRGIELYWLSKASEIDTSETAIRKCKTSERERGRERDRRREGERKSLRMFLTFLTSSADILISIYLARSTVWTDSSLALTGLYILIVFGLSESLSAKQRWRAGLWGRREGRRSCEIRRTDSSCSQLGH